jgi:hypothetical protein
VIGFTFYAIRSKFAVPLLLLVVEVLYSRGVKFGGRRVRLKAGYEVKNLIVGILWGAPVSLSLPILDLTIFCFFYPQAVHQLNLLRPEGYGERRGL